MNTKLQQASGTDRETALDGGRLDWGDEDDHLVASRCGGSSEQARGVGRVSRITHQDVIRLTADLEEPIVYGQGLGGLSGAEPGGGSGEGRHVHGPAVMSALDVDEIQGALALPLPPLYANL